MAATSGETGRGRPERSWATGMSDVPEGMGLESRSGVVGGTGGGGLGLGASG